VGRATPNAEEIKWEASVIEVYNCPLCFTVTRFPRYNHPGKLLETRGGRCGEWANVKILLIMKMFLIFFSVFPYFVGLTLKIFFFWIKKFFFSSLGFETRWILDFTDHVWQEKNFILFY
jgi:peptide-N4-(N-acetyl-beta-glucosaminyl)asparagine amidase